MSIEYQGEEYQLRELQEALPTVKPEALTEEGLKYVEECEVGGSRAVVFLDEIQAEGYVAANVESLMVDWEETELEEIQELFLARAARIHDPSSGLIGHKLEFSTEWVETPEVENLEVYQE